MRAHLEHFSMSFTNVHLLFFFKYSQFLDTMISFHCLCVSTVLAVYSIDILILCFHDEIKKIGKKELFFHGFIKELPALRG